MQPLPRNGTKRWNRKGDPASILRGETQEASCATDFKQQRRQQVNLFLLNIKVSVSPRNAT